MWRLHRYYLKELAVNFGITFLVMFAIVLVSLVTRGINRSDGGTLLDAFWITVLFALDAFPHLLSIAFLVATVLTYTRAAQARELLAIRAAGIGPRVAMTPALLIGLALTVFGSFANHYVIPDIHYKKYRVVAEVFRNVISNLKLGNDRIPVLDTGFVMTYEQGSEFVYEDCTIYCPPGKRIEGISSPIVRADRVVIVIPEGGGDIEVQFSGIKTPMRGGLDFKDMAIVVPAHQIADRGRRADRNEDLRSDQLLGEVMRGAHPRPNQAMHALFRRCCFALLPALLAPIGYCIAELMQARGRVLALVASLVPLALFYVGEAAGARVHDQTGNPWSAWLPIGMLLLFGAPLCWRQLRR